MSTIDDNRGVEAYDDRPLAQAEAPARGAAALRESDRSRQHDRRPRADRGHRHHDVPGLADHRRRDPGARRRRRLAVGGGARGHDPGARRVRPRHRGRRARAAELARKLARRRRRARLFARRIRAPAGAVARHRARRSTTCRCRASSWCGSKASRRPILPSCAGSSPPRCRRRASTTTATSSTACARWRTRRVFGGLAVLALVLLATVLSVVFATRGAMAANRTGDRGAAFHRRQERLHRRSLPAPLPAARPAGRRHRRRQRAGVVCAGGVRHPLAPGSGGDPAIHGPVRHVFDRAGSATSR